MSAAGLTHLAAAPTAAAPSNAAPSFPRTAVWCALQVTPGHEQAAVRRVRRVAGDALLDCFVLGCQAPVRRDGAWDVCERPLFPGYLFLVTADPDLLRDRLSLLGAPFVRLVQADGRVSVLSPGEVAFIQEFGGRSRVVAMSRGRIVDGVLRVDEGPLRGREPLVAKVDRHRRCARLGLGVLGTPSVTVGLEVVSKT